MTASIKSFDTREQQDEYKRLTEERIESKSISLNNIRKERMNPDSRVDFWDIENFSTGFSYSERSSSNITTHSMESKEHRVNITYNFSPKKINITPFSNLKFFENKIFKLIKDFNLNLLPSNINIRGDLNRRFNKTQYRNSDLKIDNVDPIYEKYFSLNKSYGIRWYLTNSLNLDINFINNSIIDEPEGELDSQEKLDSMYYNLKRLCRTNNFNQNLQLSYKIPINKIPLMDWISSNARYSSRYLWSAGSFQQADTLGNIIENNREYSLNTKLDISKF